ncbi:M20/M25/M40 family metallo-hydrolase [Adlercreutzia sp. ZJ304]|uniref:M20/M25/M40 family metallo-hydrolase n=1 Tax=Adlercreutzia sp. ZJ304 TaxID=2709791 RepID=UPI0013EA8627|nr:M20/M25/M40 family metallo-hydrolase [Adlercreutzia sp. ZJ304]
MNVDRLHSTFLELVGVESPSYHEAKMAALCASKLRDCGFQVEIDGSAEQTGSDTGNLIAHLPGTARGHVAFCAHMDTVLPCAGIEVVRESDEKGDIYRSAGETILSADDKAGVAAILEGVRSSIEAADPRPDITILLTTCEEQSLVGASALATDVFSNNVPCFVLDADGAPGTIIAEAPNHYTMRARISGKAAHAGVEPEAGVSAIRIAAEAIAQMPLGRLDDATTANVGVVKGGVAVNIVPDTCIVEGECRSIFPERAETLRNAMEAALMEAAARHGGSAEVDWTLDYPEIVFAETDPIIDMLKRAMHSCGLQPNMHRTGGGADANILGRCGACAITLGIGMTNFHSVDEYIYVQDLEDSARLVEALIKEAVE